MTQSWVEPFYRKQFEWMNQELELDNLNPEPFNEFFNN